MCRPVQCLCPEAGLPPCTMPYGKDSRHCVLFVSDTLSRYVLHRCVKGRFQSTAAPARSSPPYHRVRPSVGCKLQAFSPSRAPQAEYNNNCRPLPLRRPWPYVSEVPPHPSQFLQVLCRHLFVRRHKQVKLCLSRLCTCLASVLSYPPSTPDLSYTRP